MYVDERMIAGEREELKEGIKLVAHFYEIPEEEISNKWTVLQFSKAYRIALESIEKEVEADLENFEFTT